LHPIRALIIVGSTDPGQGIDPGQIVKDAAAFAEQQLGLALQLAVLARICPVVGQIILIGEEAATHRFLDGSYRGQGIFVDRFDGDPGLSSGGNHKAIVAHLRQFGRIVDKDLKMKNIF